MRWIKGNKINQLTILKKKSTPKVSGLARSMILSLEDAFNTADK